MRAGVGEVGCIVFQEFRELGRPEQLPANGRNEAHPLFGGVSIENSIAIRREASIVTTRTTYPWQSPGKKGERKRERESTDICGSTLHFFPASVFYFRRKTIYLLYCAFYRGRQRGRSPPILASLPVSTEFHFLG